MLRLLMGITLSETGGSQRVAYDIMANLPESMYDITLVTSPGGELISWVNDLNGFRVNKIKVITLSCLRREISIIHDVLTLVAMLFLLCFGRYDIAHFHNSKMGIIGRIAARIARIPKVYYTVHGWGLNRKTAGRMYGVLCLLERLAARCCTETVFVSECDRKLGIRNRWVEIASSRLIYNGISEGHGNKAGLRKTLGIPEEMPVIVFTARLAEPKMPQFAITVADRLNRIGIQFILLIIGDGPMMSECKSLIDKLGLKDQVMLLGKRDNARALLQEADIFCLFSKWEGLPISILEAMFAGLPVVAIGVGGVPELVAHGSTGYLLNSFDSDEAACFLSCLIQDKDVRLRMGSAGREAASTKFKLDTMIEQYRQLYEQQLTE
jgi:glycosyltransferase involved in cell wall biosynthesis